MPADPPLPEPHATGEGPATDATDEDDSFVRQLGAISEPAASTPLPFAKLPPGEVVGARFHIVRLAGSGGMGAVYQAGDRATGGTVAVKVMARQHASFRERFQREADVLADLAHPCVVRYVAHGMTDHGQPFLAMDWLEGEDLAGRLARAPLGEAEAFAVLRRACEGLAVAHAKGIVHRDIKPSNLFLVGGQAAATKVIDFGVARLEGGAAALTRPGASLGTAGYMAPEQAMEAADVDARADVFALGCVLYECLTGQPAFGGRPALVLVKLIGETPRAPSTLKPGLSPAVDAFVASLLAKNRDARPRDAADVLARLASLAGDSK